MRVFNKKIITNTLMNANISSEGIPLDSIYGYSIQAVFTASAAGTIKLQCSDDPIQNAQIPAQPTNWTDIADSSYTITGAGSYVWNVSNVMYTWVRVVFTDGSSGTSTAHLNVEINCKGV